MGILKINDTGPVTNGLGLLGNNRMPDEHRQIRSGVKEHNLSQEDESRANRDVEDVNEGKNGEVRVQSNGQAIQQRSEQLPLGPLVHWERFLPLRSLKVLLVENDDSTRHIVCALLRNCGYEVTAVSNGLRGWKILEDLTNHIDLVLTEVVVPVMSGIGLLRLIMNHKSRNNIPVIMMSSHDSMSIVFKCLSKGAVDFLVKPIRKNELKNLWQHVWRKWHSSSGSGSESDIRTQKSVKSKSVQESGNNNDSNNGDSHESVGLNICGGSDNGSATKSSWTKRVEEGESPRAVSPRYLSANPVDSTCAQVIHSKCEAFDNSWIPLNAKRYYGGQKEELENAVMGKDLEIGVPTSRNMHPLEVPTKNLLTDTGGATNDRSFARNPKKDDEKQETRVLELSSEKGSGNLSNQAVDLIGAIANIADPQVESPVFEIPSGLSKVSETKNKGVYGTEEIPSLELSLKRVRDLGDTGTVAHGRNVIRHTDLFAFSRYNSGTTANQAPTGNVGSCSPLDNSSEAAKTDSMKNLQSNSSSMPPNQRSNGSSNNNDMGSTTNNAFSKPSAALCDNPTLKSSIKIPHPSSAFQLVQNGHVSAPQPTQETSDAAKPNMVPIQVKRINQKVQVQHHHHHYHHHHHHVHKMLKNQQQSDQDDMTLQTMTAAAPQCGSSNLLVGSLQEGNSCNHNLNESALWSNHGSNGQNGSGTVSNAIVVNIESDNGGVPENGKATSGTGYREIYGVDQNCFSQREAALNKFRLKRKERCFTKKVRYHSRKKLAEQRPRVRGQFVRQVSKNNDRDTHC